MLPEPVPEPVPVVVGHFNGEASMRTTIADVAAHAGVSKTTVSRVLNAKGEVDRETAARVNRVIDSLGYVPSARAVGLARGRTGTVGMLIPSLTWPWMSEVLQGVADTLEAQGFGMLLFTCNRGKESLRQFAAQVAAHAFDGLLVIVPEGTLGYITELHDAGLATVLIDDRGMAPRFPSVGTTNRLGGRTAAEHLLSIGCRAPVMITGPAEFGCVQERTAGFLERYAEAGIDLGPDRLLAGDFTLDSGRYAIQGAAASGLDFDSVFAENDLSAAGAVQAAREVGRSVPRDLSVIGFDDLPVSWHTDPPLTTVHQPMHEMGAAAAGRLLGHFDGSPMSPTADIIPTSLVVRGSTRRT